MMSKKSNFSLGFWVKSLQSPFFSCFSTLVSPTWVDPAGTAARAGDQASGDRPARRGGRPQRPGAQHSDAGEARVRAMSPENREVFGDRGEIFW